MVTHMRYPNDHNHLFNMLVHNWNIRNGYVLPKIRYIHDWELRNHKTHISCPILAVPGNGYTYENPKWSPSLDQHVGAYLKYQKRLCTSQDTLLSCLGTKKPPNTHRLTYLSRSFKCKHTWGTQMITITCSICWCILLKHQKRLCTSQDTLLSCLGTKKPPNTHRLPYLSRFKEWWHIWTTQMTTITWSTCWCIFEISRTVIYFPRYVTFLFWN